MGATLLYLGIDSGSTASKCVIIDESGGVVAQGLHSSGVGTAGPSAAVDKALSIAGVALEDVAGTCATGYGRKLIAWADFEMSELSCHARAVSSLFPEAHTVIDIGGQDAKVLRLAADGRLESFVMNDKCAAGTGRFLDVMASIFGCRNSELSALDAKSASVVTISSTCTVFAESEVISKMAAGESIPNIVAGVHESVAERTAGLARRAGVMPSVVMTGGVALNDSLRARLGRKIGQEILVSPLAQFCGAYGAALNARDKHVLR